MIDLEGQKTKPRVFISYARRDNEEPFDPKISLVYRLCIRDRLSCPFEPRALGK